MHPPQVSDGYKRLFFGKKVFSRLSLLFATGDIIQGVNDAAELTFVAVVGGRA